MTAYVILIREATRDAAELKLYGEKAKAARGDHKIAQLAFYGPHQALEGPDPEGVVILQFDDMAAARAWYDSPAYQEALTHRLKGADCRTLIVEGV